MTLDQLRRLRWAVRATLVLGVAVSVAANILHALDNAISQTIAAWPPLALLLTVELISRVPVHRRSLAAARLVATASIAGIAAWVSYWHMAGVAARYGESGAAPYLIPVSVDGLIIVASICLVEIGGRIAAATEAMTAPPAAEAVAAQVGDAFTGDPWRDAPPAGTFGPNLAVTTVTAPPSHDGTADAGMPDVEDEVTSWMASSRGQHALVAAQEKVTASRRRPAATASASYDQDAAAAMVRELLAAMPDGMSEWQAGRWAGANIDPVVAEKFGIKKETARKLRAVITGEPVSGPPGDGTEDSNGGDQ